MFIRTVLMLMASLSGASAIPIQSLQDKSQPQRQHVNILHAMGAVVLCFCQLAGGGLDNIVVLMEGESLFNDATSIVLFEIFFEMVKKIGEGKPGMDGTFAQEGVHILGQIAWLTAGNGAHP